MAADCYIHPFHERGEAIRIPTRSSRRGRASRPSALWSKRKIEGRPASLCHTAVPHPGERIGAIDDEVMVFEARVHRPQLDITRETIERNGDSGFPVLHTITSYVGIIAMHIKDPDRMGSKKYFHADARTVLPELHTANSTLELAISAREGAG